MPLNSSLQTDRPVDSIDRSIDGLIPSVNFPKLPKHILLEEHQLKPKAFSKVLSDQLNAASFAEIKLPATEEAAQVAVTKSVSVQTARLCDDKCID